MQRINYNYFKKNIQTWNRTHICKVLTLQNWGLSHLSHLAMMQVVTKNVAQNSRERKHKLGPGSCLHPQTKPMVRCDFRNQVDPIFEKYVTTFHTIPTHKNLLKINGSIFQMIIKSTVIILKTTTSCRYQTLICSVFSAQPLAREHS